MPSAPGRGQNSGRFVEKVFRGSNGFDEQKVQAVIAAGQQAHYTFPESVTLYVTYRAVTTTPDGTPTFRDDVYGRNCRVVREMVKPRS